MSLHLACQSPRGSTDSANLHPPLLPLLPPPKISHDKWLQECKFKDIDRLCFVEVKFSKEIKVRVHMAWYPLSPLTQQRADLKGSRARQFTLTLPTQLPFS